MTTETTPVGRVVLLASPRSLCAGVERAIETVQRALRTAAGPVYVRKQIVHNSHVIAGVTAPPALRAARILETEGIGMTVVDPRWILPIHPTITHLAARHRLVVTAENAIRSGGTGAALALALADAGVTVPLRVLGLPHAFIGAGDRADLLAAAGLTGDGIARTARAALTPAPGGVR